MTMTFEAAVAQWQGVKRQLAALQAQELEMRKGIFAAAFPAAKEGTNSLTMIDGAILKGDLPMNRKVDDELWRPIREQLLGKGIAADDIVKYKPDLSVGAYKKLSPDIRRLVDRAVTTKPGTPALKVE